MHDSLQQACPQTPCSSTMALSMHAHALQPHTTCVMHTLATASPCPSSRSPSASALLLSCLICATPSSRSHMSSKDSTSGRRHTPHCSPLTGSRLSSCSQASAPPCCKQPSLTLPLCCECSAQMTAGYPCPGWAHSKAVTAAVRHTLTPMQMDGAPVLTHMLSHLCMLSKNGHPVVLPARHQGGHTVRYCITYFKDIYAMHIYLCFRYYIYIYYLYLLLIEWI